MWIIFYDNSHNNFDFNNYKKIGLFKYKKFNKKNSIPEDSIQLLIYTSGTTNLPKGVMISKNAILNNVQSIKKSLKLKSSDKTIIFSPPAYAMAISQILTFMDAMCEIIFYNHGLKFPHDLLEKIRNYKISIVNISISSFRILLSYSKNMKKFQSPRIACLEE